LDVDSAKTIVLLIGLLVGVPALTVFLVVRPRAINWALIGLVVASHLKIDRIFYSVDGTNLLSPLLHYRGYDRGLQVTLADLLMIALASALLVGRRRHEFTLRDPQFLAFIAYFLVSATSMIVAMDLRLASWEVFRTFKWILLFWTVFSAIQKTSQIRSVIITGAAMIVLQVLIVLYQRYALGVHRTTGVFAHPNSLGMAVNMWWPFALMMLLRTQGRMTAAWALVVAGGAGVVVLSGSRGAIACLGVSALIVSVLAARDVAPRQFVPRMAGLAVGMLLFLVPTHDSIITRLVEAPEASTRTRTLQNELAMKIIGDNPFGVGANNFAKAASHYSHFTGRESGSLNSDPGLVHNAYLLETAEVGWIGLAVLLWLAGLPVWRGFRLRAGEGALAWLGPPIIAASAAFWMQGFLEWVYKQSEVFSVFVIVAAVAAAAWRLGAVETSSVSPEGQGS